MPDSEGRRKRLRGRPDLATAGGLLLAVGGILGGLVLEGGKVSDVAQITAAIIVLGGTLGAVMVATPKEVLVPAVRRLPSIFLHPVADDESIIEDIVAFAAKARKNGIASLEQQAEAVEDPFLRKALTLAVDGTEVQEIRSIMELEMNLEERDLEQEAKVFESAGGYAPTVGIIGAVLGLIQVMKHLENIDAVGHGIAVAFVATLYGVGLANLFFLPAAGKIKARAARTMHLRDLTLEGVIGIAVGLNPKLIRIKLNAQGTQEATLKRKAVRARSAAEPAPAGTQRIFDGAQ